MPKKRILSITANRTYTICAIMLGTALEYYDIMLYNYFLFILSPLFFPHENYFFSVLCGFVSFAIGFVMRPLGGLVFGHYGDRIGRKRPLIISIFLTSVPTLCIGLLPTYAEIGMLAPLLLIVFRMTQNFFQGAEATCANVFIVEQAKSGYKFVTGSLLNVSSMIGGIVAGLIGLMALHYSFENWGWRIPFIVGALAGFFCCLLRTRIEESSIFSSENNNHNIVRIPIVNVIRFHKHNLLCMVGFSAPVLVPFYVVFIYLNETLTIHHGISPKTLIQNNIYLTLFWMTLLPLAGRMGDLFSPRTVLSIFCWLLGFLALPLFLLIAHSSTASDVYVAQVILSILGVGLMGPNCALLVSMMPPYIRFSGIALGWSLGVILFAGMTPLVCLTLVQIFDTPVAPGFYLIFCAIIGITSLQHMNLEDESNYVRSNYLFSFLSKLRRRAEWFHKSVQ